MKKIGIIFIFLAISWHSQAQQYEFEVWFDYPETSTLKVVDQSYALLVNSTMIRQSTGLFKISSLPTSVAITFQINNTGGSGEGSTCLQTWNTSLPLVTCYSLESLNNPDCILGSQTFDVLYSLKPVIKFEPGTTPLDTSIFCTSEPINLVATSGFSSYQWYYRIEQSNWVQFKSTTMNDEVFTLEEVYSINDTSYLNKVVDFTYNVENCGDLTTTDVQEYKFSVEAPIITNVIVTDPLCNGGNDGQIKVDSLSRNLLSNEYLLYDLVSLKENAIYQKDTKVIDGLNGGEYLISVQSRDILNYCTSATYDTIQLIEPTIVEYSTILSANLCYGDSTGSVSITAIGGTGTGYSYSVDGSPFNTSSTINNLTAGDHSIIVKDSNGCPSINGTITIPGPTSQLDALIEITSSLLCSNSTDGIINIIPSGGWGGYTFSTTENGTYTNASAFSGLAAGTHTYWVKDSKGCISSSDITITAPPEIIITDINIIPPQCVGEDAKVTLSATGGTGNLQYSINNAIYQSFQQFDLPAGSYNFYVRDDNLCTLDTVGITINDPQPISYQTSIVPVSCNNGNDAMIEIQNVLNGLSPYEYSIDGGINYQTSSVFKNLTSGNYNIIIKDSQNCQTSSIETIYNPAKITGTISETPILCSGDANGRLQISGSGGTGTLSYLWFDGSTNNLVSNLSAGSYSVKIIDQNGCESNLIEYNLDDPELIIITPLSVGNNGYDISCFGGTDAEVNLIVSGGTIVSDYSYLWSNGQSTSSLVNVSAGQYSITITDDNNCQATELFELYDPPELSVSSADLETISCNGANDASIKVEVFGGVGGYQYSLDGGFYSPDSVFTNLLAGDHVVTVSDLNGCEESIIVSITEPDEIVIEVQNIQNTLCGQANGSIDVNISGGTQPYSFSWMDNSGTTIGSSEDIVDVPGGSYNLTLTDANGCVKQFSSSVSDSNGPVVQITEIAGTSCYDSSDGSVEILIEGGVSPYTVNWENGDVGTKATGLPAGLIEVQVTGSGGCVTFQSIDIPGMSEIELNNIQLNQPTCFGDRNGSILISTTGGVEPYSYTWSNGMTGSTISNLEAGEYLVSIIDQNNCSVEKSISLSQPDMLEFNVQISSPSCAGFTDGSANIEILGGSPPYQLTLQGELTSSNFIQNLASGTYDVEIIDANQCNMISSIEIPTAVPWTLEIDDITLCDGQQIEISSPVEADAYQWFYQAELIGTTDIITISKEGNYQVYVENADGCIGVGEFNVIVSNDVLHSDFLMSSKTYVGDTIIVIDITFPVPDSSHWQIPQDVEVVELNNDFAMLVFNQPGNYEIGFDAYLGQCNDYYVSVIEVLEATDASAGGRISSENEPIILALSAYPNPHDGIFNVKAELSIASRVKISIVNLLTNQFVLQKESGVSYIHKFSFNYPGLAPGNYAIVLEAGDQIKVQRMIKR